MSARSRPPFRADQVGSLLRPEALKRAREQFLGPQTPQSNLGPHDDAGLRAVEDSCIRECRSERLYDAWTSNLLLPAGDHRKDNDSCFTR